VQAVGELDQDHAQVARHRQQHLAEAFRRRFLAVLELELVELGDAVDQFGHGLAELGRQLRVVERRVLDGVVQDRRDQGLDVHVLLGQHPRHRHRMGDIGFAGLAQLPRMRRGAHRPGAAQQRLLLGRQVAGRALQIQDVVGNRVLGRRGMRELGGLGRGHGASLRPNGGDGESGIGNRNGRAVSSHQACVPFSHPNGNGPALAGPP